MYIVFFFVPYIVALAIFRNYFEFNCLRKIHSKSYIRKHNTGNLPMRIVFWNFRDELNKWLYSIFIACFFMPLTMPLLWLAAGENGLEVYYCFCLVIWAEALAMALADRIEQCRLFETKRKYAKTRMAFETVEIILRIAFLLGLLAIWLLVRFHIF